MSSRCASGSSCRRIARAVNASCVNITRKAASGTEGAESLMASSSTPRFFFFFQAEDGIRDLTVTGVQTCALPICTVLGPILGSFILSPLAELARLYFAQSGWHGAHLVAYGLLLIAVVLFLPEGAYPRLARLFRRRAPPTP